MNIITMTHTNGWTCDPQRPCPRARRSAPPHGDLRARLVAYAFAVLGLALAAYGERYVLATPAPLVETGIATCAAGLFAGSEPFTPACVPQAPTAAKGATT
jgi:hypothetical protein